MIDYFKILEISMELQGDELRSVLAEKRKLWLNRCNSPDLTKRQDAEVMLQTIDDAEAILLDPEKRAEYISQLQDTKGDVQHNDNELHGYLKKIIALYDEGKWQDVISLADIARRIYPNDTHIWIYLGRATFEMKRYDEAVNYYSQALEISPTEGYIYSMMGDCRYMQNQNFEAAKMYRSARMLGFEEPFMLYRLALCLEDTVQQIVDLPGTLPVQGKALKRGFDEEAIQILEKLYQQDGDNKEYSKRLEVCYVDKLTGLAETYLGRIAFFSVEGPFRFQANGRSIETHHIWWNRNKRMPSDSERQEILDLMDKIYIHLNMTDKVTLTGTTKLVADLLDFMGIEKHGNKLTKRQIEAMGQLINDFNQGKIPPPTNQPQPALQTKAASAAPKDYTQVASTNKKWLLPAAGVLVLVIIIIALLNGNTANKLPSSLPAANNSSGSQSSSSSASSGVKVSFAKIDNIIKNTGQGGEFSFYIKDLKTGQECYSANKDQAFVSAGSIFLPIYTVLTKQIAEHNIDSEKRITITKEMLVGGTGKLTLQDVGKAYTIDELGQLMMHDSDNSAANILIDQLGGMIKINQYFSKMGLKATKVNRRLMDTNATSQGIENYTSPQDLGRLYEDLANSDYETILVRNSGQTLPAGCQIYHQSGLLTKVYNDASIITGNNSKFLVIIMSRGTSNDTAQQVVGEIIKSAYSDLEK